MKIGILTFELYEGRKNIGSSRIRGRWLAKYWKEAELYKSGEDYDVMIYQKAYWVEHAKLFKGVKIFDICFSGDTLVFSNKGWVEISNIKVGDMVLSHNGEFRKVLKTYKRKSKVESVKFSGLNNIKMTKNHPILACNTMSSRGKRKFTKSSWTKVEDLKLKSSFGFSLKKRKKIEISIGRSKAWMLGLYCADGSCGQHQVTFAMNDNEKNTINKIMKVSSDLGFSPSYKKRKNYNGGTVYFNSPEIVNILRDECGKGSDKNIPLSVLNSSKKEKLDFLEAYLAGDGYCNDRGGISVSSISKKMVFSLWQLFKDCGFVANMCLLKRTGSNCSFKHKNGKTYKGLPQWNLRLNPRESLKFVEKTNISKYKKCNNKYWSKLKSKNVEIVEHEGMHVHGFRKIESIDKEEYVYNLEVDVDNTYIADGLVVHNCDADFLHYGYRTMQMIEECDAVTTSSEALAEQFRRFTNKPVVCIPDRLDLDLYKKVKEHKGDAKYVVWFGYSSNYGMINSVVPTLAELGLNLIVISDAVYNVQYLYNGKIDIINIKWNEDTVNNDIMIGDIAINPQSSVGKWKFKSNNKTVNAWALGIPVAKDKDDLKKLIKEENRIEESKKRLEEVKKYYDIKESVKDYENLIELIRNDKKSN